MHHRPIPRLLTVFAVLAGSQLGLAAVFTQPAQAAERVIQISADGNSPVTLAGVRVGDTIAFQNIDGTFPHTVRSTSPNWSFSATINPSTTFKVPAPLKATGRYTYADDSPLEDYAGEVVVGSTATAKPTRKPSPRPSPRQTSTSSASASPTTGSGQATTPPIIGGVAPTPTPRPGGSGPPPVTAPVPTETTDPGNGVVALPGGILPEPPTPREYGLPAAVATVGAAGTASLLVRFLLAHPAGRRRLDGPVVTVDNPQQA